MKVSAMHFTVWGCLDFGRRSDRPKVVGIRVNAGRLERICWRPQASKLGLKRD